MKIHTKLMAAGAIWAMAAGMASADCAADLAALEAETGAAGEREGIAKDGSLAPLAGADAGADTAADAADAGTATDAADGTMSDTGTDTADGSMPDAGADDTTAMDGADQGGDSDLAMSGDDAQAQQEGEPTAAAQAESSPERDAAIERARTALAEGDEDACREALDEARSL